MNKVDKAFNIAMIAHKDQTDKAGKPYIGHLMRVYEKAETETEKICALLHDLVEDTDWTFEQLRKVGFSEKVIEVLDCLTKRKNEDYGDFIERVAKNHIAVRIKIFDLEDNLNIKRLKKLEEKDFERLNKYLKYYHYLRHL